MKEQIAVKQQTMKESQALLIEGLPENYNQLMLAELVRAYPGLEDYKLSTENNSAVVSFKDHEDAKLALAGIATNICLISFLYRFT